MRFGPWASGLGFILHIGNGGIACCVLAPYLTARTRLLFVSVANGQAFVVRQVGGAVLLSGQSDRVDRFEGSCDSCRMFGSLQWWACTAVSPLQLHIVNWL